MIYTVTLNPAIDLFVETDQMESNAVNRTNYSEAIANGKGVNVSFVLKMLGIENVASGIGGGFTLHYIEEVLENKGIAHHFVHVDGVTRINVFTRVKSTDKEYKLVNPGPKVDEEVIQQYIEWLEKLTSEDMVIISGSFSEGIPHQLLEEIGKISQEKGFSLVIDSSYKEVMDTLRYKPFLLKPNEVELAKWCGIDHRLSEEELERYSLDLIHKGAQHVLLTLGDKGAWWISKGRILKGNAPRGEVVNTACSGDTLLGTFLAGLVEGIEMEENLKRALAAGSSTAFRPGLTDFSDVEELSRQVTIEEVKLFQ